MGAAEKNADQCSTVFFLSFVFLFSNYQTQPQHVKVGIVGGSDLVKISEQLGENSEWWLFFIGKGWNRTSLFFFFGFIVCSHQFVSVMGQAQLDAMVKMTEHSSKSTTAVR